jgi:hypothetical protein
MLARINFTTLRFNSQNSRTQSRRLNKNQTQQGSISFSLSSNYNVEKKGELGVYIANCFVGKLISQKRGCERPSRERSTDEAAVLLTRPWECCKDHRAVARAARQ